MNKITFEQSNLIKNFFNEHRFHMTKTFFDGKDGEAYVDDMQNVNYACVLVNSWCFVNGECNEQEAYNFFSWLPNNIKVINAGKNFEEYVLKYYKDRIEKYTRYTTKDNQKFDFGKLQSYIDKLSKKYKLKMIDEDIYEKIKFTDSFCTNLSMSKDYRKNGIGVVCIENDNIVGVVTSDLVYNDSIELNIKVNPDKRREGIASALDAKFIIECLKRKIYPVVDCANMNGLKLALKIGYEVDSEYNVYLIVK